MKPLVLGLGAAGAICIAAAASGADYAPIDCAKPDTPSLRTICKTHALGQSEARMATLFSIATALAAMGQRGEMVDTQHEWLKTRDACRKDRDCLARAYASRIEHLGAVITDFAARGPF